MVTDRVEVLNPSGLHTRPATQFVQLAKSFACEIEIRKGELTANAKSLVKLLKIGISQGNVIELVCNGSDEDQALESLRACIAELKE
jgi:phosphocarrier protein HPr